MATYADRVRETSTTSGIGAMSLAGAVFGFQAFSAALSDGDSCYYCIESGADWEVGHGTYTALSNELSRDDIFDSSSGAVIDFPAGVKQVYIVIPARHAGYGFPLWPMLPSRFYDNAHGLVAGRIGQTSVPGSRLICVPFLMTHTGDLPLRSMGIDVRTATIGGNARLGIYSDNGGRPGALFVDAGEIATTSVGYRSRALGLDLPRGLWWLAVIFDMATTVRIYDDRNGIGMMGFSTSTGVTPAISQSAPTIYGPLPPSAAVSPVVAQGVRVLLQTDLF